MVLNQRMNEAFRNLIFKKEMLCILYFITVPGVYKLNKVLMLLHVFQYATNRKDLVLFFELSPKAAALGMISHHLHLAAPLYTGHVQMFLSLVSSGHV